MKHAQLLMLYLLIIACIMFTIIIRPSSSRAEESLTRGLSCFEVGYRFGKCATESMLGKSCDPKDDVIVPDRCKNKEETKRGIEAGVKVAHRGAK